MYVFSSVQKFVKKKKKKVTQFNNNILNDDYAHDVMLSILGQS